MWALRFMADLKAGGVAAAAVGGGARRGFAAAAAEGYKYETLAVTEPRKNVFMVKINRPEKLNAMNLVFWREIGACFDQLSEDTSCRAVVLGAEGRVFTAGIDLMDLASIGAAAEGGDGADVARRGRVIHKAIREFQTSFSALERCPKPVIAAVHSACVGGGVDLVCGADIRYCSSDAWFQVKEVDVGLAADVGTLQRLPKVVGGQSLARELVFTARKMFSSEALQCGFVSRVFEDKESLEEGAVELASTIASKSPVAVQTSKIALIYSRDHGVEEGLDYMAKLNMLMLQSEDVRIAAMAMMSKGENKAIFSKL
ncbi:delta(3,5)-Delta(2,4)-dienoyl-CoA isomerase, mitochondrial-like [Portunus trituberculatus]|uniref:delta(3,5)-Delta(2,4)-dienoyl-CoA isomerase, mitochondrial-like n=1 Tax=Portunus trituberculatus TaxID=210409 RepID=UPI001E1CC358|nr:delta(3,5)-Delta(2,4)-dienoyl-CoA isomerase, mitochondrial-like [Portunus trituberculatus]